MFKFEPLVAMPEKTRIYERLKKNKTAKTFLEWASHITIESKDKGVMYFNPNTWFYSQWLVVDALFRDETHELVVLKPRQMGITTIINAFDLFYAFYHKHLLGALVAADYKIAAEMRTRISAMYRVLPHRFKQQKDKDNAFMFSFKNGSKLKYLYPTTRSTETSKMGRSGSTNYAHLTEVAYFSNLEEYNSFVSTLSQEYPYRKYIYESTANGFNHFYDMYQTAEESPSQTAIFLGWWTKETYQTRNKKDLQLYGYAPSSEEQDRINEVKKRYGWEISIYQLAWYRKEFKEKIVSQSSLTKEDYMLQEFPWLPEDAFRVSGKNFFKSKEIAENLEMVAKHTPKRYQPYLAITPEEMKFEPYKYGTISVWEEYQEGNTYVVGIDSSYGASEERDNSVFTIYKCYQDKAYQVVEFADNRLNIYQFAWLAMIFTGMYRANYILEVNGVGQAILQEIRQLRALIMRNPDKYSNTPLGDYVNMIKSEYVFKRIDSLYGGAAWHWVSTTEQKEYMLYQFQALWESKEIIIMSKALLEEMMHVVQNQNGINARAGKHDDRVMASGMAIEFWYKHFVRRLPTEENFLASKNKQTQKTSEEKQFADYLNRRWFGASNHR